MDKKFITSQTILLIFFKKIILNFIITIKIKLKNIFIFTKLSSQNPPAFIPKQILKK